jgi:hypothetical protein
MVLLMRIAARDSLQLRFAEHFASLQKQIETPARKTKNNSRTMADEDDPKEYRWETGYEKTWEEIREDKEGE